MDTSKEIWLLTPVPLEHLQSGLELCKKEGLVAYGSRAYEFFLKLDEERKGQPVETFIYASFSPKPTYPPRVSWHARYVGFLKSDKNCPGRHPEKMRFRPDSTKAWYKNNIGHWAIFWHVTQLRELPADQRVLTGHFLGLNKRKLYEYNFIPQRPYLVSPDPKWAGWNQCRAKDVEKTTLELMKQLVEKYQH